MAIISTLPVSTSCTIDGDGHVTLTVNYEIFTSTPLDCAWSVALAVVAASPSSWVFGNDTNSNAFPQSLGPASMAEQPGTNRKWSCPVVYSTKPLGGSGSSSRPLTPFTTPVAEPWRLSGTFLRSEKITWLDKDDHCISRPGTGELFPVSIPAGNDTLHMEGATATINLDTRAQAIYHCNSEDIWGLHRRVLLMVGWSYEIRRHGTNEYVYHALDFEINYSRWNNESQNKSFKKVDPDFLFPADQPEKRLLSIFDRSGMPIHEPWPLDENGKALPAGSDGALVTIEAVPEFDFNSLGFPVPLPGPFV